MKKLLLVGLLLQSIWAFSQEKIEVQEKDWAIADAMQPAFIVDIPQTTGKKAINLWEKTLVPKNIFDAFKNLPKMEKEEKNKWVIRQLVIDAICADTLDVYTRISENQAGITFATLFDNNGTFIGSQSNSVAAEKANAYVRSYAIELYKQAVQDEIDDLEKELKKMRNNYSSYEKDNKKLERKASDLRAEIVSTNNDLSNTKMMIKTKQLSTADGSVTPLSEEALEELRDDEKATAKAIKKLKKGVKSCEKKIDKNVEKQKDLNREIQQQENEIQVVTQKLNNIK